MFSGFFWALLTVAIPLSLSSLKLTSILLGGGHLKTFQQLGNLALGVATGQMAVTYFRDYQAMVDMQKPEVKYL